MFRRCSLLLLVIAGCTGAEGPAGPPGTAGEDGDDGTNGMNGTNGSTGPQGPQGNPGTDGADGQLRIYGDGTAGAVTIAADTDWSTNPPANNNYQFTNLTVNAGVTLTVMSGTVIRTTGTFTNNGLIAVSLGTNPGNACMVSSGLAIVIDPGADAFGFEAGLGGVAPSGSIAYWGITYGATASAAQSLVHTGLIGGGGGAGNGGAGGGAFTVLSKGALTNAAGATIEAEGESSTSTSGCQHGGGGGGGGGVIMLASKTSIAQAGSIDVSGGDGGPAGTAFAPGGGGAGGIVHMFAPAITHTGTEDLAAGATGTGTGTTNSAPLRVGGSAGGSSGGIGGPGAWINASNTVEVPQAAAEPGHAFTSVIDPTALFY